MRIMTKVLYAAAHSGFNLGEVPLGGGAAVAQHLVEEWGKAKPFELKVLGPSLLKESAPQQKDLVRYSELQYARFCRQFEKRLTETILQYDPANTVVLCNDVSEGPDFKTLAEKGYSIFTIYHVDVVDYFTTFYLHSWLKPDTTTSLYRKICRLGLAWAVPDVLKLVWEKQESSVRYSKGLVVPSQRMKEILLRCYPDLEASRVHVLPWGVWEEPIASQGIEMAKSQILKAYLIPEGASVLLMLSRISPEKGQDRLLKALAMWESRTDYPTQGVCLFIAGEAAYMMGKKYENELRKMASSLKRTQVHFVGYAAGAKKKALFEMADLYVFPSKHESYGLTLLEALHAGLPVLTTPSYGAKEVFKPEFGDMIAMGSEPSVPGLLVEGLKRLLVDRARLQGMGEVASVWAKSQNFSNVASALAVLLGSEKA